MERARFLTTRWSVVVRAGSSGPEAREALEVLCATYWWPLYAFLRRRGLDAARAEDVVQDFLAELVASDRLAHVAADRGRFRGWLLAALKFHLGHERERERTHKRGGAVRFVSLDAQTADARWQLASRSELDPERTFEREYALATLDAALLRLERNCAAEGKADLFAALRPTLVGEPAPETLRALGERLGLSESAVKAAAHRLRASWRECLREEIAATLDDPRDADDELRAMLESL